MNNFTLTKEQLDIINAEGNIVVIAVPGSGKTTTITYKIKKILSELDEYQGVIAISYTNKASNELKGRVMNISADLHNSFFVSNQKKPSSMRYFLKWWTAFCPPSQDIRYKRLNWLT